MRGWWQRRRFNNEFSGSLPVASDIHCSGYRTITEALWGIWLIQLVSALQEQKGVDPGSPQSSKWEHLVRSWDKFSFHRWSFLPSFPLPVLHGRPLFLHFLALTYIWRLLRFRESEGLNNSYPEGRNFSQVSFQWPLKLSLVTSTLSKQWWLTFCSVVWKGTKNDIHINVIF